MRPQGQARRDDPDEISVREGQLVRALQEKALPRPNNPKGSSTEVRPIGQFGKASEGTVEGPFLVHQVSFRLVQLKWIFRSVVTDHHAVLNCPIGGIHNRVLPFPRLLPLGISTSGKENRTFLHLQPCSRIGNLGVYHQPSATMDVSGLPHERPWLAEVGSVYGEGLDVRR